MQILGLILGATVLLQNLHYLLQYLTRLQKFTEGTLKATIRNIKSVDNKKRGKGHWQGTRTFVVASRIQETADVVSFDLIAQDRKPLPKFLPGQHIMIALRIPGQKKTVKRCYSLSAGHNSHYYRITVKKVDGGLATTFLHESIALGDTLDVFAPTGSFHCNEKSSKPLVLIAGGVGITPFLSILEDVAANSFRETILINSVRNGNEHIRKNSLEKLSKSHPHIQMYNFYTSPDDRDIRGLDYQAFGRIDIKAIQAIVGSQDCEYCLCGSKQMTQTLHDQLTEWGVQDEDINMEGFGGPPAKVITTAKNAVTTATEDFSEENQISVSFIQSNKTIQWDPAAETILDLAEQNGVELESVCRSGDCGACRIGILTGCVEHKAGGHGGFDNETCLPCTAKPVEDVVLNA